MKRCFLCLLSALCLAVLLAGCASRGQTADADADLPVIKVGYDNYPPFSYLDADGQPTGIDVALAREAFRSLSRLTGWRKPSCWTAARWTACGAALP